MMLFYFQSRPGNNKEKGKKVFGGETTVTKHETTPFRHSQARIREDD